MIIYFFIIGLNNIIYNIKHNVKMLPFIIRILIIKQNLAVVSTINMISHDLLNILQYTNHS